MRQPTMSTHRVATHEARRFIAIMSRSMRNDHHRRVAPCTAGKRPAAHALVEDGQLLDRASILAGWVEELEASLSERVAQPHVHASARRAPRRTLSSKRKPAGFPPELSRAQSTATRSRASTSAQRSERSQHRPSTSRQEFPYEGTCSPCQDDEMRSPYLGEPAWRCDVIISQDKYDKCTCALMT